MRVLKVHHSLEHPNLVEWSLPSLSVGLWKKEFSSVELTRAFLEYIEKLNPLINAFITTTPEAALKQAQHADQLIAKGGGGPLLGIPVAHKDIFCTEGVRTSCGSLMLDNFAPPYDAMVVEKLKAAGMVSLGKTNMDEFAMGSSTETSYYGATKNPWDLNAVPGGSSGGAAAAVSARLVPVATATDTGGSIRQPAAFCGVTGIKPTYGSVSRYGMVSYASSLDQGGVIAKSSEDCAILLGEIVGFDKRDSTSIDRPKLNYFENLKIREERKFKVGLPKQWFSKAIQSEIVEAIDDAIKVFQDMGAELVEVDLPHCDLSVAAYYVIATSEASSNLARYDGVRYGYRCDNPKDLQDLYCRSRSEGFGDEVKRRILLGTYALSAGYYDAYYVKAQKVRRLIASDIEKALNDVDFIIGPISPTTAFNLGEKISDPTQIYLSDIITLPLNLSGRPGMSIPVGFDNAGLPIGLQVIGDFWSEQALLDFTNRYQQRTSWHERSPELDLNAGFG